MNNVCAELLQCSASPADTSVESVTGILSSMEQRLTSLKRKAEESLDEELECTQLCKMRLDHLRAYVSGESHALFFLSSYW